MQIDLLFAALGAIAVIALRIHAKVSNLPVAAADADLRRAFLCFVAAGLLAGFVSLKVSDPVDVGLVVLAAILGAAMLALYVGAWWFLWHASSTLIGAEKAGARARQRSQQGSPAPRVDPASLLTSCPACGASFAPATRCPACGLNFATQ